MTIQVAFLYDGIVFVTAVVHFMYMYFSRVHQMQVRNK